MKKLLVLLLCTFSFCYTFAQIDEADKAAQEKYMKELMSSDGAAKLMELMNSMGNAETRPVYKFPMSASMVVTTYKDGVKNDPATVKYYINPAEETFAFAGEAHQAMKETVVVYDSKNSTMVMLDDKKKSYTAMNIKALEGMDLQKMMATQTGKTVTPPDITCKKTGKTKTIKGYPCEEYICTDADNSSKSQFWVTNKVKVNLARAFKNSPMSNYFKGVDDMTGMMMEGKFYKNNKLDGAMEVTDVNEASNYSVTLSKYTKKDMMTR